MSHWSTLGRTALWLAVLGAWGCASSPRGRPPPELATRPYSEHEWFWSRTMREMYPDWEDRAPAIQPRTVPAPAPAVLSRPPDPAPTPAPRTPPPPPPPTAPKGPAPAPNGGSVAGPGPINPAAPDCGPATEVSKDQIPPPAVAPAPADREGFALVNEAAGTKPGTAGTRLYKVEKGDNLSTIARKLYGDEKQWKRIYDLNREKIAHPDKRTPGMLLRLP